MDITLEPHSETIIHTFPVLMGDVNDFNSYNTCRNVDNIIDSHHWKMYSYRKVSLPGGLR